MNRGLGLARSDLIARADADDICRPDRLKKQIDFMQSHPDVGVLSSAYHRFDETGRSTLQSLPLDDRQIRFQMLFENPYVIQQRILLLQDE